MRRIIILFFFGALIGTQFSVITGVRFSDFFCVPLFIYALFNIRRIGFDCNLIAKYSLWYSFILLISGLVNGTITNTVFINFTRIFFEGTVAFCALYIALKTEKELRFFVTLFYIYSLYFVLTFASSLSATIADEGNFQALDILNGRNAMAVSNLLIVIMLTFMLLTSQKKVDKTVIVLFPFLIFNIFFSASRFSVISLALFGIFLLYWLRSKISKQNTLILLASIVVLPFFVQMIESRIDTSVMDYSSDLLNDKIANNEDGGFAYRINDLNIRVISDWLNDSPIIMWFFGDGISITHGIFSFTFCCTGVIGFLYFLITNIKMIWVYMRRSKTGQYIAFLIFVFFLNDIVTNSRFIIGLNTLLYMGMLAFMLSFESLERIKKDENNNNTNRIYIK